MFKKDPANYAYTIKDKISENALGMKQITNNSTKQAIPGGFTKAAGFAKVAFDLLKGRMLLDFSVEIIT
ncbi:MAG: hypothetical protein WAV82_14570 [Methylobacter sp.]